MNGDAMRGERTLFWTSVQISSLRQLAESELSPSPGSESEPPGPKSPQMKLYLAQTIAGSLTGTRTAGTLNGLSCSMFDVQSPDAYRRTDPCARSSSVKNRETPWSATD